MAMYLASIPVFIIMLIGHWSSVRHLPMLHAMTSTTVHSWHLQLDDLITRHLHHTWLCQTSPAEEILTSLDILETLLNIPTLAPSYAKCVEQWLSAFGLHHWVTITRWETTLHNWPWLCTHAHRAMYQSWRRMARWPTSFKSQHQPMSTVLASILCLAVKEEYTCFEGCFVLG
jgi:hypothetical protein